MRNIASSPLGTGILAVSVLALWLLLAENGRPASLLSGLAIALAVAAWARLIAP
jgi:hypothetical protein